MYHEFDEVRRIHQPYIDNFQRSKQNPLPCNQTNFNSGLLEAAALQLRLLELEAWYVRNDLWNLPN